MAGVFRESRAAAFLHRTGGGSLSRGIHGGESLRAVKIGCDACEKVSRVTCAVGFSCVTCGECHFFVECFVSLYLYQGVINFFFSFLNRDGYKRISSS